MHEQPAVALFCCFLFVFSLRVRWEVAKIGDGDDVSHCLSWARGEWAVRWQHVSLPLCFRVGGQQRKVKDNNSKSFSRLCSQKAPHLPATSFSWKRNKIAGI